MPLLGQFNVKKITKTQMAFQIQAEHTPVYFEMRHRSVFYEYNLLLLTLSGKNSFQMHA